MSINTAWLALVLSLVCGAVSAEAENAGQKCPVVISGVDLNYNHQGGQSKPQVKVEFANNAARRIMTITFSLSLIETNGDARPYPDDLIYEEGLEPGKKRVFVWSLTPEDVDIHRAGEMVTLKKVRFIDASGWVDDGSESCELTIDFHAR